jgi:hypothetical protein
MFNPNNTIVNPEVKFVIPSINTIEYSTRLRVASVTQFVKTPNMNKVSRA